jgi:hypothetical protein
MKYPDYQNSSRGGQVEDDVLVYFEASQAWRQGLASPSEGWLAGQKIKVVIEAIGVTDSLVESPVVQRVVRDVQHV